MTDSSNKAKKYEGDSPLALHGNDDGEQVEECIEQYVHHSKRFDQEVVCKTDTRGSAQPGTGSPLDLVVNANDGFIPLWDKDVTLRWRFQEPSFAVFVDPDGAKDYIRQLFGEALLLWTEDAIPVRFKEAQDAWDFEIVVNATEDCDIRGCTLARAFFPDGGRHELRLFPTMFEQSAEEQVETMAHELGHVFGLRHFFALVDEAAFPAEVFGTHQKFSIMNYGADSVMTEFDRSDLATLYQLARCGVLTNINGTPVRLVRPFSDGRVLAPVDPACTPAMSGLRQVEI